MFIYLMQFYRIINFELSWGLVNADPVLGFCTVAVGSVPEGSATSISKAVMNRVEGVCYIDVHLSA